jgi:hypothetical protein
LRSLEILAADLLTKSNLFKHLTGIDSPIRHGWYLAFACSGTAESVATRHVVLSARFEGFWVGQAAGSLAPTPYAVRRAWSRWNWTAWRVSPTFEEPNKQLPSRRHGHSTEFDKVAISGAQPLVVQESSHSQTHAERSLQGSICIDTSERVNDKPRTDRCRVHRLACIARTHR